MTEPARSTIVQLHMRLVLLLLLATPLFAQREFCRFRASDEVDPFRRWLSSPEVICSATSDFLGESATLHVQLPDAHTGVVYLPRRAVAYPVSNARAQVPADEEMWLITLEKRSIASIIPIPAIEAGTERTVDGRIGGLSSAVLGWLRVDEQDRKSLQEATGILAPQVRLTFDGPSHDSDPLPSLSVLNGAFFLVRGVPAGAATLDIGGKGWLPHRTNVTVGSRAITIAPDPLLVRPAGSLIINFNTDRNLADLNASLGICDESKQPPVRYEIFVSACPKPKRDAPLDPKTCKLIRQEWFGPEVPYGSFTVDDVAPGLYRVEMHFAKLPPVSTMAPVAPLQQQSVRLRAPYMTLYGSLTHGGEPLRRAANIAFPNDGVGFSPGDGSDYRAVLLNDIIEPDAKIDITGCEGEPNVFVLSDEFIKPFTRFDIDIPDNSITVSVTDTFTHMTLHNATLRYVVLSKRFPHRPLFTRTLTANDTVHGRFVIEAVPERKIELTVSHGGYQKYMVEPFTMGKSEHKTIDAQMMPLRGMRGRIVSPVPFDDGLVMWLRAGGRGESVDIGPDGTFAYESMHDAGEIMVVVSRSHPLWVLRMPEVGPRQTLDLRFPDAPVRMFDVKVEGADRNTQATIEISVGGLAVPSGAFWEHQRLRGGQTRIMGNRVETVHDILETGPIEVNGTRLMPGVTELVLKP